MNASHYPRLYTETNSIDQTVPTEQILPSQHIYRRIQVQLHPKNNTKLEPAAAERHPNFHNRCLQDPGVGVPGVDVETRFNLHDCDFNCTYWILPFNAYVVRHTRQYICELESRLQINDIEVEDEDRLS